MVIGKLKLNITTEDGELLEVVEVEVTDDKMYPIGMHGMAWSVMHDIEDAARIVQARAGTKLICPNCGKEVWDKPYGYKLAKCWGCGIAFDTMSEV